MLSTRRQLELMRDLQRLANERHLAEEALAREHTAARKAAEQQYQHREAAAQKTYEQTQAKQKQAYVLAQQQAQDEYDRQSRATQAEYRRVTDEATSRYESTVQAANEGQKQATWQALAVFDASKNNPREQLEQVQQLLAMRQAELNQLRADAETILQMRRLWHAELAELDGQAGSDKPPTSEEPLTVTDALAAVDQRRAAARDRVAQLQQHRPSQLLEGATPLVMTLAAWAVLLVLLGFVCGWQRWWFWLPGSFLATALLGGAGGWWAWRRGQQWARQSFASIAAELSAAHGQIELAAIVARQQSRQEAERLLTTRDRELAEANQRAEQEISKITAWRDAQLSEAKQTFPARLAALRESHQQATAEAQQTHREVMARATATYEAELRAAKAAEQEALLEADQSRQVAWQAMRDRWFSGFHQVRDELAAMQEACQALFPDWNQTDYASWTKPTEPAEAIQFGTATLELRKVRHAISADPELRPEEHELPVPTLVTLHEQPSLVVAADGTGRERAVELLQTVVVRYLTGMPPGRVRLTVCDPVGLGKSFASLMHLADHDENLVSRRIWSEGRDIDEQLARLTNHMETILQKYLRDEYDTIHEYNAQAGELVEPFQVVAIANFPHGFSDAATRRLLSLVTGGPRCGVYVLLSLDKKHRLPNDFDLDDLLAPSVHLDWDREGQRFVWRYPVFEHMPLALPEPIESERLVRLMKQVGQLAKESIKVEVPFDVVAPAEGERWTQRCDQELAVPIGRSGANRLQYVRLGIGTAQHLLVAGRTGSGKSTFLHALVTSAALHYSPAELEFYLVDFKKGVEFKPYALHRLPHARVIAIESEREFGLSVLERLDEELRHRGDRFREAGVQSLADYRAAHPNQPMPRIVLVIDEFQELFVEDDRLAQQAGLLLDRLVRQGRAFGMHVLLGSQTLSGAYSLARSTLGQMAVRVALPCSEADAHLILSDERNQAARFLSRPGEAIYNNQNGLVTGNQPFQVVWLPDRERTDYLAQIRRLSDEGQWPDRQAIVFEGNAPADPRNNVQLMTLLGGGGKTAATEPAGIAWLGAAVAIKPPTSVTFARHGGSNLLVVGQQPAAALGVLTTAAVSLAAGHGAQLVILDGTRDQQPGHGTWHEVAQAMGERTEVVGPRTAAAAITRLAAELARREAENDEAAPPVYLVVYNASRFRDLRKREDDFSFSLDNDKPPSADKQLAELLRNGPPWGIHVLVWCDGYNAVTRLFDRLALREFELRVAFQMSAADSSNLIDSPAASKLSQHRALVYHDETGEVEKFRPYGPPTDEWIRQAAELLSQRSVQHEPS